MLRAQAARLLAVDREAAGTRLLLLNRDEAGVGSAEGSVLRVADASVANRHAVIRYVRGRYYVVDLKSAEGTFLNGRRIRRRQELKHGDIIRFGGATPYRFIDPDALKRRRWRRILRASAVITVLVAVGLADHIEKWGLFSGSTVAGIGICHQYAGGFSRDRRRDGSGADLKNTRVVADNKCIRVVVDDMAGADQLLSLGPGTRSN